MVCTNILCPAIPSKHGLSHPALVGRLTSGDRGPMTFDTTTTQGASQDKRQVSGVKIKTVTRGFSTEADKLLNYLVSNMPL